jgi:hypothetical protein
VGLVNARAHFGMKENAGTTVAEILKAFWAFLGIASPVCSGFKSQSHFSGVARSTYVGSPFRNTSRVGGGVELKKTAIFVLIRAEIGPTKKWQLLERECEMHLNNRKAPIPRPRF